MKTTKTAPHIPVDASATLEQDMRQEYDFDFSTAVRGKYAKALKSEGSNMVLLEPELAKAFPDSAAVNAALRSVLFRKTIR